MALQVHLRTVCGGEQGQQQLQQRVGVAGQTAPWLTPQQVVQPATQPLGLQAGQMPGMSWSRETPHHPLAGSPAAALGLHVAQSALGLHVAQSASGLHVAQSLSAQSQQRAAELQSQSESHVQPSPQSQSYSQ